MANYKASDFFVGIVDLLAIFLPGVILALWALPLAALLVEPNAGPPILPHPKSAEAEAVLFITAAFFLGNLAYGLGAGLEEMWKKASDPLKKLDRLGSFLSKITTIRYSNPHPDSYARQAGRILRQLGHPVPDVIPSKRYCTILVTQESDKAAENIERLYGLSRFFRSFSAVFLIIFISGGSPNASLFLAWEKNPHGCILIIGLGGCSFAAYLLYRHLHEMTVFRSVIALLGTKKTEV